MAKKLGKKARKFARKNLQSAAKRHRKLRSQFKHRSTPRKGGGNREDRHPYDVDEDMPQQVEDSTMNRNKDVATYGSHLEDLFPENDTELDSDMSDSDGYLSEDPECLYYFDDENDNVAKDCSTQAGFHEQNEEISLEIARQEKKLNKLQAKDPEFASYLEKWQSDLANYRTKEGSDEDDLDSVDEDADSDDKSPPNDKILTSKTINEWCHLVAKEPKASALCNLLNAFQDACRYGVGSNSSTAQRLRSTGVFSQILTFVLSEADNIFRIILEISSDANKGKIMNLKNAKKWKTVEPMIKSYLRSSLDLLNQLTDNQILTFVLFRLRASAVFFAAYPSIARRLIKITVHLWASGDQSLSLSSFLIIREVASMLPDCLDVCLTKMYKTFVASSKIVEDRNIKHIGYLMNCLVELYSLDIQKSCDRAVASLGQLNAILKQACKSKEKEDLRKIDNWQYINCVNLWVRFICCNHRDYDLRPLFSSVVQTVRGVSHLFQGARYIPLRLKCVQMLNELSSCSQLFFPIASLVFDCVEFSEIGHKEHAQKTKISFSLLLKVPKNLLKSRGFQEECILSAIALLSAHFAQWSYHISFPELATIPLIVLKRLLEQTTIESLHRPINRLIDQVNENKDFILRKREAISFSPNDQASVENFLQLEKSSANASFTQFYRTVSKNHQSRGTKTP